MTLFPDIQIKTQFRIQNKAFSPILLKKIKKTLLVVIHSSVDFFLLKSKMKKSLKIILSLLTSLAFALGFFKFFFQAREIG